MKFRFKILTLLLFIFLTNRNAKAGNCIPSGTTVTLSRQSEVDSFPINYPVCDVVEGELIISGSDITNLSRLSGLKRISGSLDIINNQNLLNLSGLNSIKYARYLTINNNDALIDLSGFNGLDSTVSLDIRNNNNIRSIGMTNLKFIFDFYVYFNDLLVDFSGLNNLQNIIHAYIQENPSLVSLNGLNNVSRIANIDVSNNISLLSFEGLGNLIQVNNLYANYNNSLLNFFGLHNLTRITEVFNVANNLSLLDFSGLGRLSYVKYLFVNDNLKLKSFNGLNKLDTISIQLDIRFNSSLCSINELKPNIKITFQPSALDYLINVNNNPALSCCKKIDSILNINNNIGDNNVNLYGNGTDCNNLNELRTAINQNCCTTKYTTIRDTICSGEQKVFNSQILTNSGTYYDTLVSMGNDSIIILQLKVYNKSYQITNKNLCIGQSFTLSNGRIITTAGIYKDTIPNICDSIIEYRLSFLNNITVNQNAFICKGKTYTLPKGNTVSVSGIYNDTLRSSFGCDSIITTNLTITNPVPVTTVVSICEGQAYTLPDGNSVTTAGTYTDTIRNINTCDSIVITNLSVLPNNFIVSLNSMDTIESGNTMDLIPLYTGGTAVSWNWTPASDLSCTSCENPTVSPVQTTQYMVKVQSADGCEDTAQTTIAVRQTNVYVPQAFTPNNDGVNDVAEVFAANPAAFSMKIYNRWGELVFESTDVNTKWNGTYKGENCPQESYSYILDVTLQNQKQYHKQGSILLLR